MFDSIAAGISSLFGLATPRDEAGVGSLDWGRPLAALALVLAGIRIHRLGRVPRWLWVTGAIALSFWVLAGFNLSPGREAPASRYQYVSGIFILMVTAELVRGLRASRVAIGAGIAAVALAVTSNLNFLDQSSASYVQISDLDQGRPRRGGDRPRHGRPRLRAHERRSPARPTSTSPRPTT